MKPKRMKEETSAKVAITLRRGRSKNASAGEELSEVNLKLGISEEC